MSAIRQTFNANYKENPKSTGSAAGLLVWVALAAIAVGIAYLSSGKFRNLMQTKLPKVSGHNIGQVYMYVGGVAGTAALVGTGLAIYSFKPKKEENGGDLDQPVLTEESRLAEAAAALESAPSSNQTLQEEPADQQPAQADPQPAASASQLPDGWAVQVTDTGLIYYLNEKTGDSSWERPEAISNQPTQSQQPTQSPADKLLDLINRQERLKEAMADTVTLPEGWGLYVTSVDHLKGAGVPYWVNMNTGEQVWERPIA